jgi:hypothetical protein
VSLRKIPVIIWVEQPFGCLHARRGLHCSEMWARTSLEKWDRTGFSHHGLPGPDSFPLVLTLHGTSTSVCSFMPTPLYGLTRRRRRWAIFRCGALLEPF